MLMRKLFGLVKVMFKIGCIGFGGGSALIPVLEKEAVTKKSLVSKDEFDRNVVVASITPGALPVEIASGIGLSVASYPGMVIAAMAMALPGAIVTVLLLTLFANMEAEALRFVSYIAVPVSVYIIYMLVQYMKKAVYFGDANVDKAYKWQLLTVLLLVFVLNGGKEIYTLTGIEALTFLDLSSIQILGMAFFAIFFLTGGIAWWKATITLVICLAYSVCAGKNGIEYPMIENGLKITMFILGGYGVIASFRRQQTSWNVNWAKLWKCLGVWIAVLFVMIAPACIACDRTPGYIGNGMLSSLMSFGGGDAYLSVAEGLFVQSEMISEAVFYGQLVVIVNVLPGSILCKTLAGVGYIIGYGVTGNVLVAIAMAVAGFGVSVFGSCSISVSCLHLYSGLEHLEVFQNIKRWVRPIIGGTLLSICLSMLAKIVSTGEGAGIHAMWMVLISVAIFAVLEIINKKLGK